MWIAYVVTLMVGLCLGSFLNVVIYRLPRELGIVFPGSACPHCKQALKWRHNIPVLSFIFLKGKCAFCHQKISLRYPAVEIITALTGLFLLWKFGLTLSFGASSLFSLILIALIFIDLEHQLLPDILTLPLLWLGLMASLLPVFTDAHSAIIGAVAGYLSLWCVAKAYEYFTHREGMGHGDFKLLAALCAWTGWQGLLPIILIASIAGSIIGISLLITKKVNSKTPIPFGPFLAVAGWIVLFLLPQIMNGEISRGI
jgi:leader peptidase (prepilin peptidase) / N-methyltransferase